ncbi:MAG: DoxX family protein [Leptospiraceae bacterium]|nr:DoxX family protein [Leptospiraceae bacterium]MDW8307437.1 DoxX family protein [Leptospiraceae bacterium]
MSKIGRFVYAIPFVIFGSFHFLAGPQMTELVPSWLPAPLFWVYFTGLALIAGALGIMLNRLGYFAALGLALLLFTFALTVHLPRLFHKDTAQLSIIGFLKDIALAGAALHISTSLRKRW